MKSGNIFQQPPQQQPKKQPRFKVSDTAAEQFRSIGSGVASGIKRDLFGGIASDAANSIFGSPRPQSSEQRQTPEFPFARREQFGPPKIEKPREHFVYSAKEAELEHKVAEIRQELKVLIEQLKQAGKEVSAIEQQVNAPAQEKGVYYLNFLDRLKVILKVLVKELQDSNTWLTMMKSRKQHKGYWAQYKKKGTSFGLSDERKVSNQAG